MGQGHSSSKNSQQQLSKYAPRESDSPVSTSTKHKKRGSRSSKSSSSLVAANSTSPPPPPPPSHGSSSKKNARKEGGSVTESSRTLPPGVGDRRLPAVPVQPHSRPSTNSGTSRPHPATRNSSLTHRTPKPPSHRSQAPPSLPSRQFSLSKPSPTVSRSVGGSGGVSEHTLIEKYYNLYKDREEDVILAEGIERFCIDLNVDPTDFIVLVLAWKFDASQMCRFTREEFMNGCQKMEAYDAKSLRNRFPRLLQDARDDFKDLYQFTFSFGLDRSVGQRSLPTDMAVQLWELVFTQDKPPILDRWCGFLNESDTRGISRDTWNMFLDFCQSVEPDLSNYDESEAWPSLFDDFVDSEQTNVGSS